MLGLTPQSRGLTSRQELLWPHKLAAFFSFLAPHVFGQSGAVFQGQVLDRSDSPITGASVALKSPTQTLETKSDSKGHFEFVVPLEIYELEVSARGFETRAIKNLRIAEGRTVTIFLDLGPLSDCCEDPVPAAKDYRPGGRLEGFVMDEFGAVVNDASVSLRSSKQTLQTSSDPRGLFVFKHVRNGRYTLVVSAKGFQAKTIEDMQITGKDSAPLKVVLDAAERP